MASSREVAAVETENLQACLRTAAQIKKLREKPLRAGASAHSATELAHLIEVAAQKASLPTNSIIQIDPLPARRLGNSAYQEQPTHVELHNVGLKPLIIWLNTLTGEESGAELAELRLSAPRDSTSGSAVAETWTAEVTLTHLIFAP